MRGIFAADLVTACERGSCRSSADAAHQAPPFIAQGMSRGGARVKAR